MSTKVPYRSRRGCLTCKQRKKKCDEVKPECERCRNGNFECLGYNYLDKNGASASSEGIDDLARVKSLDPPTPPVNAEQNSSPPASLSFWPGDPLTSPFQGYAIIRHPVNWASEAPLYPRISIPKSIRVDPLELDNMIQFITSLHSGFSTRAMFRPFPFPITEVLSRRIKKSSYTRWAMYIGARIVQALVDGTSNHPYVDWIHSFHRQVTNMPHEPDAEIDDLGTRLDALQNVCGSAFIALGNPVGYELYKNCIPLFLQLAAKFPEVWTHDSAISISRAIYSPRHEIAQFILTDTILALAFGMPPFIHYDTTISFEECPDHHHSSSMGWMYGWPAMIVMLFAKLNSARVARQLGQPPLDRAGQEEIKQCLKEWRPAVDQNDQSSRIISRQAIQECWRHIVLIYMYMGACGTDSADPGVEASVQQVAQLVNVVEEGDLLELHLQIPCVIAGVAARKEKHRRVFHRKLQMRPNISIFLLRGPDFIPVLDHLWHGAAAGGCAVTWDDYVNSRSASLPINI